MVDVSDNAPVFTRASLRSLSQKTTSRVKWLPGVTASSRDSGSNAELVYSLEPEPAAKGLFTISPETGDPGEDIPEWGTEGKL